jgi:hypothetical protein
MAEKGRVESAESSTAQGGRRGPKTDAGKVVGECFVTCGHVPSYPAAFVVRSCEFVFFGAADRHFSPR